SGADPNSPFISRQGTANSRWTWAEALRALQRGAGARAGIAVDFDNGHTRLDYTFNSLIDALRVMYTMNLATPATGQIRLCKLAECGQPFIARYERAHYCNDSHANRDRQRTFFARKHSEAKKKGKSADGRQGQAKRR